MVGAISFLAGWIALLILLLCVALLCASGAVALFVVVVIGVGLVGMIIECVVMGVWDWIRDVRDRR